jgi:hypothetical protein
MASNICVLCHHRQAAWESKRFVQPAASALVSVSGWLEPKSGRETHPASKPLQMAHLQLFANLISYRRHLKRHLRHAPTGCMWERYNFISVGLKFPLAEAKIWSGNSTEISGKRRANLISFR